MENTVGSLTEEQRSIIIGTLLGDGCLRKKTNTLLEINHSYKQKDYVTWLFKSLENIVITKPKLRNSGINRFSYRFTTRSISELNDYFFDFYQRKSYKSIPIHLNLNGLSLAVWFMDDGSRSRNSVYLNTQQFDDEDQNKLRGHLKKLGIDSTLNKDKSYYRIRVATHSVNKLKILVEPYLHQSMRYKLP